MYRIATDKYNPFSKAVLKVFMTMINDFLDNLAAQQYLKMHNDKQLITEVESDSYQRKKGKRKNV